MSKYKEERKYVNKSVLVNHIIPDASAELSPRHSTLQFFCNLMQEGRDKVEGITTFEPTLSKT